MINPRPLDQTAIFRALDAAHDGFITYSEGCNDDVNKSSGARWAGTRRPTSVETLREYGRYFIGDRLRRPLRRGSARAGANWRGPVLTNAGIDRRCSSSRRWSGPRRRATLQNWRFQQALYRAYYDAFVASRLSHETRAGSRALDCCAGAAGGGARAAMDEAEASWAPRRMHRPRRRAGAGLRAGRGAVPEHPHAAERVSVQAIAVGRGATRHDRRAAERRAWLAERFAEIRKLADEDGAAGRSTRSSRWTDPGPAASTTTSATRRASRTWSAAPAFRERDAWPLSHSTALTGVRVSLPNWRMSWMSQRRDVSTMARCR